VSFARGSAPTKPQAANDGLRGGRICHIDQAIHEFDGKALYAALDAQRQAEGLSWQGAAAAIWEMAPALNAARAARRLANHPISPSTLQSLGKRGATSCQHALFFLRWLERTPESFLVGAGLDDGVPLPACGPDRRPRWNLKALHAGLNEARTSRGATWAQTAQDLRCQPGQLTGLKTARFATGIGLAMRITQWAGHPAADFIYPARW
jgi:hypothetical protein